MNKYDRATFTDDKKVIGATRQELAEFDRTTFKDYCKVAFIFAVFFVTALALSGYFASTGS